MTVCRFVATCLLVLCLCDGFFVIHDVDEYNPPGHGGIDADVPLTVPENEVVGTHATYTVHSIAEKLVLPAAVMFLTCILWGNMLSTWRVTSAIPESAATILVSVCLGLAVRELIDSGFISLHGFTLASAALLNLLLLPIILFNSGWCLRTDDFMSQFEYILVFAIFGTLISTAIIGSTSWWLSNNLGLHGVLDLRSNLVFAALISATDPVATLASYAKLKMDVCNPLLNTLVFGESAINDAVAIVLFNMLNTTPLEKISVSVAGGEVLWLLLGSLAFGVCLAAVLVLAVRCFHLPADPATHVCYIFISAYFIFAFAESIHLSGIIANLFAGIVFRKYGAKHLPEGDQGVSEYLELSAHAADMAVFILCGASTALMSSKRGFFFGCIAVILCLVARAMSVSFCSLVSNGLKRLQGDISIITASHQLALWHGGLRGGIALVLALSVDSTWCPHKATIINATFLVICFLLLVFGSTTEVLLSKLQMMDGKAQDGTEEDGTGSANGSFTATTTETNSMWRTAYQKAFSSIDEFLTSILVGEQFKARF